MKHELTRLNPLDMALMLMLFEGATLFVMAVFNGILPIRNPVLMGAAIGILGTPIALMAWHGFGWQVRGRFAGKPFALDRIYIPGASFANASFLAVLFLIQEFMPPAETLPSPGVALFGLVGVGVSLALLFALYNMQPFKLHVKASGKKTAITGIAVRAAVLAGVYEAVILPIMVWLLALPLPTIITFTLSGLISGFIGGLAGTLLFNVIAPILKPWIETK
jgi:hypothetical protein